MPILFLVERNNLITQCIMRFRFLVKDYDGFSHTVEKECSSIDAAKERAKGMLMDVNLVESVTIYSILTEDSCGPDRYIGWYQFGEL